MSRPDTKFEPKKEALMKTAFNLFLEQGYENTSVSDIMKVAGLTRPGLYHYFSSKEEILESVIDYALTKDIANLQNEMKGKSVKDKLLLFTRGGSFHNEILVKLRVYRKGNRDSYASYRIREKGIHAYIPVLESIINQGIAEGIYQIGYSRQIAEFMVLLVRSISEDNILPSTDQEGKKMRFYALLQLMEQWLHLDKEFMMEFAFLFEQDLNIPQTERRIRE